VSEASQSQPADGLSRPPAGGRQWSGARVQIWLGLVVALATIYLAARAVDFGQLIEALRAVRLPFVLLALCTALATNILKAARWRALFHPRPSGLSLWQLSNLIVVGQAVNFYIPARLGELVRAYLTGEEAGISKTYALGTIAAEKLIDIIVLAILLAALLPFLALPDWLAGRAGPLFLTALAVLIGIIALTGGRHLVMRAIGWGLRCLPPAWGERWQARINAGLDGLNALAAPRAAAAVWGWTIIFWLVAAFTNYALLLAFDLAARGGQPAPLIAFFLLAVLQAGVAVPSTPGKIGVFHYLCIIALAVFHVPATIGLAYGLVLHALVVGGVSLWAAVALWRRSWNLRRLAEVSQAKSDDSEPR
jgi:uncharacterized protein (TIRG00374 family)